MLLVVTALAFVAWVTFARPMFHYDGGSDFAPDWIPTWCPRRPIFDNCANVAFVDQELNLIVLFVASHQHGEHPILGFTSPLSAHFRLPHGNRLTLGREHDTLVIVRGQHDVSRVAISQGSAKRVYGDLFDFDARGGTNVLEPMERILGVEITAELPPCDPSEAKRR
jgi:hypothetical protein